MVAVPLRILLIEPSPADAEVLVEELGRGNYVVEAGYANSVEEFQHLLNGSLWDVIISEYEGDEPFSGPHALAALKGSGQDIPFIVVSRHLERDIIMDAFQNGANDFFHKGIYVRLLPAIERERQKMRERQKYREAEAQLRGYNQRLVTLHAIDQAILNDVGTETVCAYALRFISALTHITSGEVVVFDLAANDVLVLASYQHSPQMLNAPANIRIPLEKFPQDDFTLLSNGQVQHVPRILDSAPLVTLVQGEQPDVRSYLMVPITSLEGLSGAIILYSDMPNAFAVEHIEVVSEISHQLAIAIRQSRFVEQIQRSSAELEQRVYERTKALQHATHRMAAILNNTSDAIIVTDGQGRIQETNPAFRELFGYRGDTMTGFGIAQMFDYDDDVLLEEALKAAVTFGKSDNIDVTGIRADGTQFEADIAVASILESGVLENIVYTVRDMTRRKLVEQELRIMLEQQRELNELKSRFVSMASHEFRTPLAIIRTTTDMLGAYRNRMDEATIDMRLDKIRAQITHMTALMDDVLTLARDQAGKSSFEAETADFDEFCRDIIDQLRSDVLVDHEIIYSCHPRPHILVFDRMLMLKVVNNLISNAIKYSPKGSTVTVEINRNADQTTLKVTDCGVGIPEADQARLFEAFHRGSNVGTVSGTGLGLTIAKQSIDAHGGTLRFVSREGEGTTFTVVIPAGARSEG